MHIDKLCLSDFICAEISDYHPNGHFESNDKIHGKYFYFLLMFHMANSSVFIRSSIIDTN